MSRYVQRCDECRLVRGATSFRVFEGGGRSPTCRWCESITKNKARDEAVSRRRVRKLMHEEGALIAKLVRVRRDLARARGQLAADSPAMTRLAV